MAFVTHRSILEGVKRGDEMSWERFYRMYRPLVWLRGSDFGLNESEQCDLLSDVMKAFFDAQKTFVYDSSKGRFRDYFREIIRNQIYAILRRRQKASGNVDLDEVPEVMDERPATVAEEEDWQAMLFRQALEEVKNTMDSRQVQAFILCRLQQQRPNEVAKLLGVSQATVYNDCKAVFVRLQEVVKELDQA